MSGASHRQVLVTVPDPADPPRVGDRARLALSLGPNPILDGQFGTVVAVDSEAAVLYTPGPDDVEADLLDGTFWSAPFSRLRVVERAIYVPVAETTHA